MSRRQKQWDTEH